MQKIQRKCYQPSLNAEMENCCHMTCFLQVTLQQHTSFFNLSVYKMIFSVGLIFVSFIFMYMYNIGNA
jgi:hypothetical protein